MSETGMEGWSEWAIDQYHSKYAWRNDSGEVVEDWAGTSRRVVRTVLGALGYTAADREVRDLERMMTTLKFVPGGRYLACSGRPLHQVCNCFLYRCEDSREGWADLMNKSIMALMTGGGVGTVFSDVRHEGAVVSTTRGLATGPLSPMQMQNECARHIMSGGFRRAALWGGLHWWHPDIFKFIHAKDWPDWLKQKKSEDYSFPAPLDMMNVSVILDDDFFEAYHDDTDPMHDHARAVYRQSVSQMLKHGEPGFSVNCGADRDECLRNACTEITSADDSDVCNLGHVNMARIESESEMEHVVQLGTLFLLAGTVYSDVPHDEIRETRDKNRRLGLGLMGVHEWLVARGYGYEVVPELREYLEVYEHSTIYANGYADKHCLSRPLKTRAIAPTGTTGIIGQTTTGQECILYTAFKRYTVGPDGTQQFQYVLDPTAKRMMDEYGVDPDELDTAYTLSLVPERRLKFLAEVQEYVDHGISSTFNVPHVVTDPAELEEYGDLFMQYLPRLRGLTCYPDGARPGQPIQACTWAEAEGQLGVTFDDNREGQCQAGACGV